MSYRYGRRHREVLKQVKNDLFGQEPDSRILRPFESKGEKPSSLPAIESIEQQRDPDYVSPCLYQTLYGFHRPPFNNTPDPGFFFLSRKHAEGLSRLLYAAQARKGFVLLTGEIGSGKTTVCRALIHQLEPTTKVALITNTAMTSKQLILCIAEEFGIDPAHRSKGEVIQELNKFLIRQLSLNVNVLLILDEAQNLANAVLEEVRMLSNLETAQEKLIQIFLVGQPQLREKINSPELKQLRQRIALRYHMMPLDHSETVQYIQHRLKVANGVNPPSFAESALELIFEYTQGIPRLINTVCDNALIVSFTRGQFRVSRGIIEEVIADLEGLPAPPMEEEKLEEKPGSWLERFRQVMGGWK